MFSAGYSGWFSLSCHRRADAESAFSASKSVKSKLNSAMQHVFHATNIGDKSRRSQKTVTWR
jgi:hypothetical protein